MKIEFFSQQAISRVYFKNPGKLAISSAPENPINWQVEFEIVNNPFDIQIAQPLAQRATAGAMEYIDPELNSYLGERWPMQIKATGWIESDRDWLKDNDGLKLARQLTWMAKDAMADQFISSDQLSKVIGYRREFSHHPKLDIMGKRRNTGINIFVETDLNEPVGPGLVALRNIYNENIESEFVWSELLKFPRRTNFAADKEKLIRMLQARERLFNSHSELRDSRRHLNGGDNKAAVRSAASAIEASLLQCIDTYNIKLKNNIFDGYDKKISAVLKLAGLPLFPMLEPAHAINLRHLYRARNKMHEGDCYYVSDAGAKVKIRRFDQVSPLVDSAHAFVYWLDTQL